MSRLSVVFVSVSVLIFTGSAAPHRASAAEQSPELASAVPAESDSSKHSLEIGPGYFRLVRLPKPGDKSAKKRKDRVAFAYYSHLYGIYWVGMEVFSACWRDASDRAAQRATDVRR